jgi:DNA-directed RNA polymerase alpha subunit
VSADQHSQTDRPDRRDSDRRHVLAGGQGQLRVETTRLGQRIDYDKLTLEVWTDASILPHDAVAVAARILVDHFRLFTSIQEEAIETETEEEVDEEKQRIRKLLEKSVEELELSVRSSNCLRAAEIKNLGDLVQKSEVEMLKFRNFGRKSLKEIQDILSEMGLHFGMDVSPYIEGKSPVGGLDAVRDPASRPRPLGEAPARGSEMRHRKIIAS